MPDQVLGLIADEPKIPILLKRQVAAAGHDRTIINIKRDHVDAWLNPEGTTTGALQDVLNDKQHPYYEHREAA